MTAIIKYASSLAAVAGLLLISAPAFAADEMPDAHVQDSSVPLYSGGIGDDEIAYIHSVQNQYNTKFLFTESNGEYLADLPVNIRDGKGETVVSTVTNGPILLVNLPAGSYTVSATDAGVSREQKVTVSTHKLQTVQFRFPGHDLGSEGY